MRGAFIVGLLIVALIVGLLVMKNMGTNDSSAVTQTQAKKYIEKAEDTAGEVNKKLHDFKGQAQKAVGD